MPVINCLRHSIGSKQINDKYKLTILRTTNNGNKQHK